MSSSSANARFSAFAHRDFRVYWAGQAISLIGTWMQQVAQGWVVASLTTENRTIAWISLVGSFPILALSLQGGAVADRYSRRDILIATQIGLALLAFTYGGLIWSGHLTLPVVFALALLLGVVVAFDLPAQSALAPELVPPKDIPSAIALNMAAFHGARLIGPGLAGLLMYWSSTASAFFANGFSYFAVIASLLMIRRDVRTDAPRSAGLDAVREGIRYVRQDRALTAVMGFTAFTTALVFPFLIVFPPIFVKVSLHASEAALGVIMAAGGFGALGGALALMTLPARHRGRWLIGACALSSVALLALSRARNAPESVAAITFLSLGTATGLGLAGTILQTTVSNELRGRVMSIQGFMFTGLMPAAALLAGVLADRFSLRWVMATMAGGYALLALPWLLRAGFWSSDRPSAQRDPFANDADQTLDGDRRRGADAA